MGKILGLTGGKGKGKTHTCLELAGRLIDQGVIIKGFCSPPVFTDGIKTAIDVVVLPSFERRRLGVIGEIEGFTQVRVWSMDPAIFKWIDRMLGRFSSADVLIFDEFGPLEVEQGKGWFSAMDVLRTANYQVAVLTFRPDYQNFFRQKFPEIEIFNLDDINAEETIGAKVEKLLSQLRIIKA